MPKPRTGIYPGTFDPVTNGHFDIILRARRLVDHLIIAVALNDGKHPMFDIGQRLAIVEEEIAALDYGSCTVEVRTFDGLLMDFADKAGATMIIRGLRAVSDFEYEFQMAQMNRELWSGVETIFLTPDQKYSFLSASLVREVSRLGGDVSRFVSEPVLRRLQRASEE